MAVAWQKYSFSNFPVVSRLSSASSIKVKSLCTCDEVDTKKGQYQEKLQVQQPCNRTVIPVIVYQMLLLKHLGVDGLKGVDA